MLEATARRAWGPPVLTHWASPVAVGLSLAGVAAFVATHNPHIQQVAPPCLLHATTGVFCPACGGTRAAYDLMQGDLAGALQMNAFTTLLIIPPAVIGLLWWFAAAIGLRTPRLSFPTWLPWAYVGALGLFWLLRNLPPFAPYLAP